MMPEPDGKYVCADSSISLCKSTRQDSSRPITDNMDEVLISLVMRKNMASL